MQHMRRLLLYFVIIVVIMVFTACGSPTPNTGTSVATTSTPSPGNTPTATPTPVGHFKVGQTVNVGNLDQVTVNSVKTETGEQYITPTPGNIYLLIDITVKNISTAEQQLSEINYTFRDVTGVSYSQVYINAKNSPWGKAEPQQLIRGQLAYEVPSSQKTFTLAFQAVFTSPGQTIWDIQA
jgi:uncharacterized lipoprotein YehR (DUF1307 family)